MMQVVFLDAFEVIKIHDSFIEKYGGLSGFKDGLGGLEAALNRPKNYYHYKGASIPEMAAIYAYSIAGGHAFNDGNKRTGTKISEVFLIRNGYYLIMENFMLEKLILDIADEKTEIEIEYVMEQFSLFSIPF